MPLPIAPINLQANYRADPTNSNITGVYLTWQEPPGQAIIAPILGYNVYKNDGMISTGTPVTDLFWFDTTDDGLVYVNYYVTTVVAGTLPTDPNIEGPRSEVLANYSSVVENLINDLRMVMKDNFMTDNNPPLPDWTKRKFSDTELLIALKRGLNDINITPMRTSASFETASSEWYDMMLTAGQIFLLISQGILEMGKEFSYSDNGISITIDRSGKYQSMMGVLLTNYALTKKMVKLQYIMTLSGEGIESNTLPWKIRTYSPRQFRIR